ncbi:MAG: trypsin-like peptidase domain-containing protein [Lachnospiraceae bacterium]|nr:trypsin-like peptidase domain-containing protein [Lachnospiraceae bacterium]
MSEERQVSDEERDDSYSFLKETVKRRPRSKKKILVRVAGILLSAVLFGAAAALVFLRIVESQVDISPQPSTQVHIEKDVDSREVQTDASQSSVSQVTDSAISEETASGISSDLSSSVSSEVSSSAASETVSGEDESSSAVQSGETADSELPESDGTDAAETEKTEEEQREEALLSYTRLNEVMKEISEETSRSMVQVTGITNTEDWFSNTGTDQMTGCGMIVARTDKQLLILTDGGGIEGAEEIHVTLPDGSIIPAQPVKKDPITNLCVIAVQSSSLPEESEDLIAVAELGNSYDVRPGDAIIAVGSPLGYSQSVVFGEVTSVNNRISVVDGEYELITTNCLGSSSGSGALVDLSGKVVGCIFQGYAEQNTSVITGIPISLLKGLIETLSNDAPIPYIGITGEDVTEPLSQAAGVPTGVYVSSVDPDSPALTAGLLPGDVIREIDGQEIYSMTMLHNRIVSSQVGKELSVLAMRRGADGYVEYETSITVGEIE